jgi:hypothetical protein
MVFSNGVSASCHHGPCSQQHQYFLILGILICLDEYADHFLPLFSVRFLQFLLILPDLNIPHVYIPNF